jgi:hypothetical protein
MITSGGFVAFIGRRPKLMKPNSIALLRRILPISIFVSFVFALAVFGGPQGTPTPSASSVPCDDVWTGMSSAARRAVHTAIWTGTEIIVWGGSGDVSYSDTGGRYDPATDNWVPTSTTNAPTGRTNHTAVWTGTEMIIWGGQGAAGFLNTGGRYDPATDTWTATSTMNAPIGRYFHTAIWTGQRDDRLGRL